MIILMCKYNFNHSITICDTKILMSQIVTSRFIQTDDALITLALACIRNHHTPMLDTFSSISKLICTPLDKETDCKDECSDDGCQTPSGGKRNCGHSFEE